MKVTVAELDFEQVGESDVRAWSLFRKAKEAGEPTENRGPSA